MTQVQYFNGVRFALTKGNKYFVNTSLHKAMHRYVWEYYNGKIPEGYDIHHKDGNRYNNDISNLECLSSTKHKQLHGRNLTQEQREWRRNNLNTVARPKAIEWHKSAEGRKWHSEHAKNMVNTRKEISNVCLQCGKEFTTIGHKTTKFCSGACAQQYRRDHNLDKIERICVVCGKSFLTDKYRPAKTCSRSCANKIWDHTR